MKTTRLAFVAALLFTACGGGTSAPPTASPAGTTADAGDSADASTPAPAAAPTTGAKVDDTVDCDPQGCTIHVVTERAKAELEGKPSYASRTIRIDRSGDNAVVASLAKIPWVTDLRIESEHVTDLAPLVALKNLRRLNVAAAVTNLAPLGSLVSLEHLTLRELPLKPDSDLSALASLGSLTSLTLGGLPIENYDAVGKLGSLRTLELFNKNAIKSLGFLAPMTKLTTLQIRNQPDVHDLSPIASLSALETLELEDIGPDTSIAPLRGLTKLKKISLATNRFREMGTLGAMRGLESVTIAMIPSFSDPGIITGLPLVRRVALTGTGIKTVAPLVRLAKIEDLAITRTPVTDVSPLVAAKGLNVLVIGDKVSPASEAQLKKALPNLHVERVHD